MKWIDEEKGGVKGGDILVLSFVDLDNVIVKHERKKENQKGKLTFYGKIFRF